MKNQLRDLIARGQTEQALQQLRAAAPPDSDLHNDAVQLLGQYQRWLRNKSLGLLDPTEVLRESNLITNAAMVLIGQLPDGAVASTPVPASSPAASRPWWKSWEIWLGIVAILSLLIAVLSYLNDRGIWPPKEETPAAAPPPVRDTLTVAPTTTVPKTEAVRPAEPKSAPKNQTNITVNGNGKVGAPVTGDANKIDLKQDF